MNIKKKIETRLAFIIMNISPEVTKIYLKPIFPPSVAFPIKGDFFERRKLFSQIGDYQNKDFVK